MCIIVFYYNEMGKPNERSFVFCRVLAWDHLNELSNFQHEMKWGIHLERAKLDLTQDASNSVK